MEKVELIDNPLKWGSIELMMQYLLQDDVPLTVEALSQKILDTPMTLTQKYDGTNLGVDEFGEIYGRNKMVPATEKNYMKVDLTCVKQIDAKLIKDVFLKAVGIESVQKFVVYGELKR